MNLWQRYQARVQRCCCRRAAQADQDVMFWRDRLFADMMVYLLPLSLLALVPGVWYSLKTGLLEIVLVDMLMVLALLWVALVPGISIASRKTIILSLSYCLTFVLLFFAGLPGPGLTFLFAVSVIGLLILDRPGPLFLAIINTGFCVLFGLAIHFGWIRGRAGHPYSLVEWTVISSNVLFLSYLVSALLPRLFNGLQQNMELQYQLRTQLQSRQSELAAAVIELEKKNAELEQFAYVASHDLKEPLRMVNSFMTLLQKNYSQQLDDVANTYVKFAANGAHRMHTLIDDLLAYSRTSKEDLASEDIDPAEIVQELSSSVFRDQLIETGGRIDCELLPVINGHYTSIRQLFQNLIGNAITYRKSGQPPLINVSGGETSQYWHLSVADNGIGISAEYHRKIFKIFQRLHSKAEFEGSGIGLALCQKIVEEHQGRIWVESIPGEGSTFHFTIRKPGHKKSFRK